MDQKTIKEYIRALEHMTSFMRTLLEEEQKVPVLPSTDRDKLAEFTDLRFLAKTDAWPEAIPDDMICGEEEDHRLARAAGIINDFIRTDLTDKTFLDFGCGEGHVPYVAANLVGVKSAVGYDPKVDLKKGWLNFNETSNLLFSNDLNEVKDKGPYDIILLNDVIDHASDPRKVLEEVRNLKRPEIGKIYMRCHPWTSRHGTHLYKQLNKAYLHLVFSEEELHDTMGLIETPAIKYLDPIAAYRSLIKDAGFSIVNEETITHPVELFFTHRPQILGRIKQRWAKSPNKAFAEGTEFPREILEIQFVDYILV